MEKESQKSIVEIYVDWANHYLERSRIARPLVELERDVKDGTLLALLIEAVVACKVPAINFSPDTSQHMLDNIKACLDLLKQLGVDVDDISPHDIHEGHTKPILSLFFGLSRFKQHQKQALRTKMVAAELISPATEIQSRLPTLAVNGIARVSFLDRNATSSVPRRYSAHPVLQDNNNRSNTIAKTHRLNRMSSGSQSGLVPPKSGLLPPSTRSSRAPSPSLSNQGVPKGIPSFGSKRPSSLAGSTQSLPQAVKSIQKPSTGIPRAPSTQQVNQIPKEIPKPTQKKTEPVKQLKAPTSLGVQKPQVAQVTKLEPTPPSRNSSNLPSRKPVLSKVVPPVSPASNTANPQSEPANQQSPLRVPAESLNAANTPGLPLSGLRPPSGHFGRPRPSRPSSVISNSSDQSGSRRNSRLLQLSTPPLVPESAPPLPPKEVGASLPPPRPRERREERSELLSEELPPAGLNDISPDDCCPSPSADDSGISYETSPKQSPDLQQRLSDSSLDTSRESHLSEENPTVVEVVEEEEEPQPTDDVDVTVDPEHDGNHAVLIEENFNLREPLLEIKSLTLPKPTAAVKGTQQLQFNQSSDVEVQERNTLPRCGSTMHKVAMVSPMVNNNSQSSQKHSLEELKAEHRKEEEEEMDSISPMQPLHPRNAPYGSYLRTNQGSSRFIPGGKYHVPSLRLQADPSRVAFARHLMAASQDMARLKYPHVQEQEQGGYMSDGDVLRPVRGGALALEEIPSGYLSEGGASLYRRRQEVPQPSPAPPPNANHPQGVNSPHKKMDPKLINVLCDDSLKIPPVNTTVLRHPRIKALDDSSSVSSGLSDTFNEISANDGLTDSSLSSDPYGVLKRHGVHSLQAAHSGSRNVQQTLVKRTKDLAATTSNEPQDSRKDSNKDRDANAKKDKLKKKEAKAKSKMMIMIRNGVSSNDVKLYGTVDPPEAILEAAKHENAMHQMEQSAAMSASLKSRPESVASIASLNSTKSAPAKPPADPDWSPYKRRVSGPEDGYATLEGIQKAYLHQQEMHWQMPLGPAHPSIHPPRSNKSLLHEAESMESLLSAHSQQQAQSQNVGPRTPRPSYLGHPCYSPPTTPQRSSSALSNQSNHRLIGSSLPSSPQPAYASYSLRINRAERRSAQEFASKTLPHNSVNSRHSQGSSRFLYGSPGLNHVTPPRGMRFSRDDEAGLGSTLSLVSTTSSMYSTPEEKQAHEIRRLRKELDHSNDKVVTLTAQLTTNAHMVAAFEQSLSNMTSRLQHLTATAEQKDSELMELRKTIEALQQQSAEAGLTKAALQSMQAVQRSNTFASKSLPHLDNSQNQQLQLGVEEENSAFSKEKDALLRQDKRCVVRRHTFNTSAKENGSNAIHSNDGHTGAPKSMPRQLSSDSMSSVNSANSQSSQQQNHHSQVSQMCKDRESSLEALENNMKKNKKKKSSGWLRTSFGKAFSRGGSGSGKEDGNGSDSSVPNSPQVPRSCPLPAPIQEADETDAESRPTSELVEDLRKQLRDKDMVLTDIRLEALSSAHQLDQMKELVSKLKNEITHLKADNERLSRLVGAPGQNSENSSQCSIPSLLKANSLESVEKRLSSSDQSGSPTVDMYLNDNIQESRDSKKIPVSVHLGISGDLNKLLSTSSEIFIGCVAVSNKTSWTLLDAIVRKAFKEYVLKIDPASNLGLSAESVQCYHIGDMVRQKDLTPELLPCGYLVGNDMQIKVVVKGTDQSSLDALAFETLIPKSILARYVSLLMEHKRIILCGPSGTGKTFLAQKLAEFLSKDSERGEEAIPTFNVDRGSQAELKNYLANIAEQSESGEVPQVVIVDNLHHVASLSDVFNPLFHANAEKCPFIIGTMNQARCSTTNLQLNHNFRWVLCANHIEPVKGLLGRCLRRRLVDHEARTGLRSSPELQHVIDWMPQVWMHVNKFLETHNSADATIGPRLFLTCPVDLLSAQVWFTDLWNYTIVPYLVEAAREGLQLHGQRAPWEDPLEWVKQSYPFEHKSSQELVSVREDDIASGETTLSNRDSDPLLNMLMRLQEAASYSPQTSLTETTADCT